ncbi:MAG: crossover junction endodeoxyribonuclease RuvC [Gammaproteobacteria bacterium]
MSVIRILGIDPGSVCTGYGIIDLDGNHACCIHFGVIKLQDENLPGKLAGIYRGINQLIEEYQPAETAVEKVFMHRNADAALKLGQARGAAITACANQQLPVFEYTANQVKQATVGKGHAAKQQVQHMVKVLLCLPEIPEADAADALAVALCHGHSREGMLRMSGISGIKHGRLR